MDRLDALREAALRLDEARDAVFLSAKPSSKAKADLAQAETDYAKALAAVNKQPAE